MDAGAQNSHQLDCKDMVKCSAKCSKDSAGPAPHWSLQLLLRNAAALIQKMKVNITQIHIHYFSTIIG